MSKIISGTQFNLSSLAFQAEIVQSPIVISPSEARTLADELEELKRRKNLTALRGERQTDLTRPIATTLARRLPTSAPTLCRKIREVEHWLAYWASALFVRTVKYDKARFSSTATGQKEEGHWHFDAGKSSLFQWSASVWQFYLNIAAQPRYFRIYPLPLPAMIREVAHLQRQPIHVVTQLPANQILEQYQSLQPTAPMEQVEIPSGYLALFDGRRFAHDAGKWSSPKTQETEPDIVLAFDLKSDMLNQITCRPDLSFLDDVST